MHGFTTTLTLVTHGRTIHNHNHNNDACQYSISIIIRNNNNESSASSVVASSKFIQSCFSFIVVCSNNANTQGKVYWHCRRRQGTSYGDGCCRRRQEKTPTITRKAASGATTPTTPTVAQ
jgi:hypothetical protein